jgi:hypothetical protein
MEKSRLTKAVDFVSGVLLMCFAVWCVCAILHSLFPSIPLFGFIGQKLWFPVVAAVYCLAAWILGGFLSSFLLFVIEDEKKAVLMGFAIALCILLWLRSNPHITSLP